jgi:hypothetical protein
MPEKAKRIRILAGPNASGKITAIAHILANYHCGYFLNADELHQQLQTEKRIEFSLYNLFVSQEDFTPYLSTQGKSWKEKAANEGQIISLEYSENGLVISQNAGAL